VESGYAVTVIAGRQRYDDPRADLPKQSVVDGVRVVRVSGTAFGRAGLLGRAIDYSSFYLAAFAMALRRVRRGDRVVTATDPPLIGVVLAPAIRARHARQFNWLHDLFPEIAQRFGVPILRGRASAPLQWLRDRNCRRAAGNVVLGERMRDALARRGVERDRLTVIPNWAPKGLRPIAHRDNPMRAEWELSDVFVVGYSGNLGRVHEFETLLGAAARLRDEPRVRFLIIGGGAHMDACRERASGLGNVVFKPYLPRERLSQGLSCIDVHIVSLLPAFEGCVVPSKIYGIAAVGRPAVFIGDPDGEVARVLATWAFGRTVRPGRVSALVSALQGYITDEATHARHCANALSAHEARFAAEVAFQRWQGLLSSVGHLD